MIVRQQDRHPSTEGMPEDQRRAVDADGLEEGSGPVAVVGEVGRPARQGRRAPEAGQRRRIDVHAGAYESGERALVGLVVEAPPVQKQSGWTLARLAVAGGASVDGHLSPLEPGLLAVAPCGRVAVADRIGWRADLLAFPSAHSSTMHNCAGAS